MCRCVTCVVGTTEAAGASPCQTPVYSMCIRHQGIKTRSKYFISDCVSYWLDWLDTTPLCIHSCIWVSADAYKSVVTLCCGCLKLVSFELAAEVSERCVTVERTARWYTLGCFDWVEQLVHVTDTLLIFYYPITASICRFVLLAFLGCVWFVYCLCY